MEDIVSTLKNKEGFVAMKGATDEAIARAEVELGTKLSEEYRRYVAEFGAASFEGHELTGVCNSPRLSVVEVTLEERELNPSISSEWYVVEQLNIDNVVIWQNSRGEIFRTMPGEEPMKIFVSLLQYLKK